MKRVSLILSFLCAVCTLITASPKREMRAAWVATVWAIDWPSTESGSWVTDPTRQKQLLVNMLDSMKTMNMNCVAMQVRTMSDAWYDSKYEPWSKWITGTRGQTPTYDPLEFAVTEAHKRGMELHVWINPYRYASSATTYEEGKALPNDYANTHPEWLMTVSDATILNPGLPEVKTRICEVVADILEKYDIDGVLFDDYFYLSGTPNSMDAALYQANNPQGLSQADWRREQVNEMVRRVQDTILVTKPWVTFGIGPAPQVASSKTHADKYGVPVGPFADWQYNSIYSDPLAWFSRRTIDYIAPQMYWHVGSATCDFTYLSAWWSLVAEKYGRHFYASPSISDAKVVETAKEIETLRNDDRIGAQGSVAYSIRSAIYAKGGYPTQMRNKVWTAPALPPQKWWRRQNRELQADNVRYTNGAFVWDPPADEANVRYAVYYMPKDSISKQGQFFSSKWLQGITYTPSWQMNVKSNYTFAVAVLDRYGNEYSPVTYGGTHVSLSKPVLTYPDDNSNPLLPVYFTWTKVEGADSYFIEFATDNEFKDVIGWHEVGEPRFNSSIKHNLAEGEIYYWRVMARGVNAYDVWSDAYSFRGNEFSMESPLDGATDVSLQPYLSCDSVEHSNVTYTFDVATAPNLAVSSIVYSVSTTLPHVQVPDSVLFSYTKYYARVTARYGEATVVSNPVGFTTLRIPASKPVIIYPTDGQTISATSLDVRWQQQAARGFRAELSTHVNFAPRLTKNVTVDAFTFSATFANVDEGDYYLRVRASDEGGYVDSDTLQIHITRPTAVDVLQSDRNYPTKTIENGQIIITKPDGKRYNVLGQPMGM